MKLVQRFVLVLLVAAAAGCTRWDPPRALPAPDDGTLTFTAARVTPRTTGMMMVMHNVRITGDSVIGRREGAPDRSGLLRGPSTRVAVHRDEVLLFEPAVPDPLATAGGTLAAVLVGLALYAVHAMGSV